MESSQRLLRVSEVAKILGISRNTVYRMIARGDLPSRLVGGSLVRVPVDAVLRELGEDESDKRN